MNVTDLRRELNDEPLPEPLDPDILVVLSDVRERGARRKRRLFGGVAVLVAVSLGLTTAVRAGWLGASSQSYVAGAPSAPNTAQSTSGPASTPAPTGSVTVVVRDPSGGVVTDPTGGVVTATPLGSIPPTGVIPAEPYAAVGQAPAVRTIPDNTWVEVVSGFWVATWQTNIITSFVKPALSPDAACAVIDGIFDCRGTIHNTNRNAAFGGYQAVGSEALMIASSSFQGTPMSTKAETSDGSTYWGVCWRLSGIAGWTFTVWTIPQIPMASVSIGPSGTASIATSYTLNDPILTIYDAAGSEIGRFGAPR